MIEWHLFALLTRGVEKGTIACIVFGIEVGPRELETPTLTLSLIITTLNRNLRPTFRNVGI